MRLVIHTGNIYRPYPDAARVWRHAQGSVQLQTEDHVRCNKKIAQLWRGITRIELSTED